MFDEDVRMHHYFFVHYFLSDLFMREPEIMFFMISEPEEALEFLITCWKKIGSKIEEDDEEQALEPSGLSVSECQVGDRQAAIITMPTPMFITEAFYVLLLINEIPEGLEPRCFTLERTLDDEGPTPCGIVCEWSMKGSHVNYGNGMPPDPQRFCEVVDKLLVAERRKADDRRE